MMHENQISEKIIGAVMEVHRILGPGRLESVYQEALCHELHLRGLKFVRQQSAPIPFKDIDLPETQRQTPGLDHQLSCRSLTRWYQPSGQ